MTHCSISTGEFLDKKNNPSGRLDAGYGIALSNLLQGEADTNPKHTIAGLFSSSNSFNSWLRGLRKLTNIEDVENHIALAIIGERAWAVMEGAPNESSTTKTQRIARNARLAKINQFSPKVTRAIRKMAKHLCEQEAADMEEQIKCELATIRTLRGMSKT